MRALKVLALAALMSFVALPAAAAEVATGETYSLASGETLNENLYIGAGEANISGTVDGDVVVGGGTVTITGQVNGDILAAGGTIDIRATVGDDVRVAGGDVEIAGNIGGDVLVGAGTLALGDDSTVAGDVIVGAGDVRANGVIEGRLLAGAGSIRIDGDVLGDVMIRQTGEVVLGESARVAGAFDYQTADELSAEELSRIEGEVTFGVYRDDFNRLDDEDFAGILAGVVTFQIIWFIGLIIVGLVALKLLPGPTRTIENQMKEKPWMTLLVGILTAILTPAVILVLFITVVGIPLAILLLLFFVAALMVASLPPAYFLGRWIMERFGKQESRYGAFIVGMIALAVAYTVLFFIPFIGALLIWLIELWGLGLLVRTDSHIARMMPSKMAQVSKESQGKTEA